MRRSATAAIVLLAPALLHIHLHLHHRIHGAPLDYVGLAAAAGASWIGLPGPGEPVLVAAAIIAARHRLSIVPVLLVAWLAATAGGIIGWAIGLRAGRAVITAPGPLHSLRLRAVGRGEEIFERHPVSAILLTPAFVAGIHRVRSRVYQPINVVSAAVWAVAVGLGGYYIGPAVLDWIDDAGTGVTVVVGVIVVAVVVLELSRRRRRSRQRRGAV